MEEFDKIKELERKKFKTDTRNLIDVTLLGICITLFGLVATIKPEIISSNPIFTLQLVLSIPFFMCCLLTRIKDATYSNAKRWYNLGYVSFTLAYGFFINAIGLLLSFIAPVYVALIFLAVNTILTLTRGTIEISYKSHEMKLVVFREISHLMIIIFLGVLPILHIY